MSLPRDVVSYMLCNFFSNYDDLVALNRTCTLFHEIVVKNDLFLIHTHPRVVLRFYDSDTTKSLRRLKTRINNGESLASKTLKIAVLGEVGSGKS